MKITEKASFNKSEASHVYNLSRQKFIENAKKWSNVASFWKSEACSQTVLPDMSLLKGQKLMENAKIQKFKWDILTYFQTLCKLRESLERNVSNGVFAFTFAEDSIFSVQGVKLWPENSRGGYSAAPSFRASANKYRRSATVQQLYWSQKKLEY